MAPLTIESAREQEQKKLEQLEKKTGVDEQIEQSRRLIERLNSIQTPDKQIAEYGPELWNTHFARLSEMERIDGLQLEGEKLRNFVWQQLPDSLFKRFQEMFCHPNLIIPAFRISNAQIVWLDTSGLNTVKGCLVNIENVPDKLMQNLHLLNAQTRTDKTERLIAKGTSVTQFKKIFDATWKLDMKNERVRVIEQPSKLVERRYPGSPDIHPEVLGSILYTRETKSGTDVKQGRKKKKDAPPPRKLSVQYFSSIYDAERKTHHQRMHYRENELAVLADLTNAIQLLNQHFDEEWKAGASNETKDALMDEAAEVIEKCVTALEKARNAFKVRIYDLMSGIDELLIRKNATASMAKMQGSLNALQNRRDEITPISGHTEKDQIVMRGIISNNQSAMIDVRKHIVNNSERILIEHGIGMQDRTPQQKDMAIRATRRMIEFLRNVGNFPVRPFKTYIDAMKGHERDAEEAIQDNNNDKVIDAFVRAHVTGKLQAVQTCVEYLKALCINPNEAAVTTMSSYVQRIKRTIEAREIFPDRILTDYRDFYESIEHAVRQLEQYVQELHSDETGENHPKIVSLFRDELDAIDTEALVRQLSARDAPPSKPR